MTINEDTELIKKLIETYPYNFSRNYYGKTFFSVSKRDSL